MTIEDDDDHDHAGSAEFSQQMPYDCSYLTTDYLFHK